MTDIIDKKYFTIGEVAAMIGEATSLVRFWEKEFPVLKPLKTGDLIIQKVTANFHGAAFESNSLTINVKEY